MDTGKRGWLLFTRNLPTLGNIQIEEITVQDGLHNSSHNSNEVKEAFKVVSVDPVQEVQPSVGAQGEQVVAGDGFRLACLADHEQLGKNGHRFQVDGECPQNLQHLGGH